MVSPESRCDDLAFPVTLFVPPVIAGTPDDGASQPANDRAATEAGEELFHREWVVGDARSPGGDGLGPVYNETSCVACHNLGGAGGAGPANKNVVILTAVSKEAAKLSTLRGVSAGRKVESHPGFDTSTSVPLHRFGTDPDYENWRLRLLGLNKTAPPRRISDEKTGNQRFGPDPLDISIALEREAMTRIESRTRPARVGNVLATFAEPTQPRFLVRDSSTAFPGR